MLSRFSSRLIDNIPAHINAKWRLKSLRKQLHEGYHLSEFDHHYLRYRTAGRGQFHLVFAADPPVTLECYDSLIRELSPRYRISVLELPGFGYSFPKHNFDFAFDHCVDDLANVLMHWRSGPYVLAFPCASAFFSLALAQRYPALVSHIAMMQAPDWQQEQHWKQRLDPKSLLRTPGIGQLLMKATQQKVARDWLGYASNTPAFTEQARPHITNQLHKGGCYCLASALQSSLPQKSPELGGITQPAMMIYGDQDRSHRKTDFNTIRLYSDDIRVQAIPGAGHFPELEYPQQFSRLIDQLLVNSGVHSTAIS
ncbi:alpha/beta fold hydrolase [Ketobacter nezhaii]|uniref:alpha/beta fold hydrolase n=1 Tax=Ketobacter sp. MCCC 1A13808 TaxID=2602738 RepID=UPI0018DB5F86|nr:alpha/beta hydrolase [Ketobacter sp. MCCC 1A13808]